jgi:hypothetical protein
LRSLHFKAVALLLGLSASGAAAQDIDSPYRFVDPGQQVNAFVGAIETDIGTLGLGPESDMAYGLRYGIRLAGPFSVEGAATIFPTARAIRDTVIAGADTSLVGTGSEADMTIGIIAADLRFDLTGPRTWHRLMPFALLGVGAAFKLSEDDAADDSLEPNVRYDYGTRLVGELGLGVEWIPVERFTLRLDARNMLWKIEAPTALRALEDAPSEEWVQNFLLSAGVSFRF